MSPLKYLVTCFTFIGLIGCSEFQNDLMESNLKGKVNKVIEARYSATEKFGELTKDTLEAETTLIYNKQGFLIDKFEKGFSGFNDRREKFEYNSKEKLAKITALDTNGSVIQTYLYDYDNNNRLIKWQNISDDKEIFQYEKYKYNGNGLQTESISYNKDGSVSSKCRYTYDSDGNCIEKNFERDNATVETHKQKFNQQKKLIELEMSMYNRIFSKELYKYLNGELIEKISYPSSYLSDTTIWKYEYLDIDKIGNWKTKTLHWSQGKKSAVSITERKIVYHE